MATSDATAALHPGRRLTRFSPLSPFFHGLRQMARRRRTYLLRFGYLAAMLGVLSLAWAGSRESRYQAESLVAQSQRRAELGHIFLMAFAIFSVIAMHLLGPVLTSSAIGAERLKRTLDALLMTPLSAWQIVGGKLFSRMLTAVSLIGLTLPVLAIVRLLGGVPWEDLFGSVALAAATALGSAAIGLLLSCFLRRAFAVILLSLLIQAVIYFILPMILSIMFLAGGRGNSGNEMAYFRIMTAINPTVTASAAVMRKGMFSISWWPAVLVQLLLALLMLAIATRAIRREARVVRPTPKSAGPALSDLPRGPAAASREASDLDHPLEPPLAQFAPPSAVPPPLPRLTYAAPKARAVLNDNPVLWREIRRPLLSRRWQRATATGIALALLGASYLALLSANALGERDLQIGYAFTMTTLLFLMIIVLSATAIATEKESDTWTTLIASPLSGPAIVWGKFRGIFRRLRWPMILMAAHFALFTLGQVINFQTLLVVLWVAFTFGVPWMATGLYFSLRCTRPTTAVVMNLLLPFAAYAIVPMVLVMIESIATPYQRNDSSELVCYYLPFYYQAVAIERLSSTHNYGSVFSLPMRGGTTSVSYILPLALFAGVVLLAITAGLLLLLGRRFDRIVGRADGGPIRPAVEIAVA